MRLYVSTQLSIHDIKLGFQEKLKRHRPGLVTLSLNQISMY
jgi:hypothetical protein